MTRGFAIKMGRFNREMKRRGIDGPTALARQIDMDRTTTWRILTGRARPGPDFVSRLLGAWDMEFHDLFDDPRKNRRAA